MKFKSLTRLVFLAIVTLMFSVILNKGGLNTAFAASGKPRPQPLVKIISNSDYVAIVTPLSGRAIYEGNLLKKQPYFTYQIKQYKLIKGDRKLVEFCTDFPLKLGYKYLLIDIPERWKRHYSNGDYPKQCGKSIPFFESMFSEEVIEFSLGLLVYTDSKWLKLDGEIYSVPSNVRRYKVRVIATPETSSLNKKLINLYDLVNWKDIKNQIRRAHKK